MSGTKVGWSTHVADTSALEDTSNTSMLAEMIWADVLMARTKVSAHQVVAVLGTSAEPLELLSAETIALSCCGYALN